ncbi:MAG TPA: response regulator [Spirochaetota bacterium]|nr:response regulator [Spirochaetota bacterium]
MAKKPEKRKTVVIVDDEDDVRQLLNEAFKKEGYNVYLAENGLKLIAILRAEKVDAVLLDINLPWLSGYQICKSIKNDQKLAGTKVIYVSGMIVDEEECYSSGCDGVIKKPFRISAVIDEVNKKVKAG